MIKKTSHSQSIEQYRFGPMSESDRLKFEQELIENPRLNHEFQLDIEIEASLKQYDILDLRRKLFRVMNEEKAMIKLPAKKTFHSHWYMVAASITFLILLVGAFRLMSPVKYTNNTLFEMYYTGESSHNLTRSSGNNNNDEAMTKYREGNYSDALLLFNEILDKDPDNIYIRYYSGLASIESNQNDKAITEFRYIVDQKNNLFVENAEWYLALSYLKNNQVKEAKNLLVQINNSSNPHNKEASQILKRITE